MDQRLEKKGANRSRQATWWLILAACWLQTIVTICILQEVGRTQSPISEWYDRVLRVLGLS